MKYLGKIEDGKDLVNKEYVDDNAYELPIANTTTLGGIKPDGTTITVDENGVASSSGGGGGSGFEVGDQIFTERTLDNTWHKCDGSFLNVSEYPALAAALPNRVYGVDTKLVDKSFYDCIVKIVYGDGIWVAISCYNVIYWTDNIQNGTWTLCGNPMSDDASMSTKNDLIWASDTNIWYCVQGSNYPYGSVSYATTTNLKINNWTGSTGSLIRFCCGKVNGSNYYVGCQATNLYYTTNTYLGTLTNISLSYLFSGYIRKLKYIDGYWFIFVNKSSNVDKIGDVGYTIYVASDTNISSYSYWKRLGFGLNVFHINDRWYMTGSNVSQSSYYAYYYSYTTVLPTDGTCTWTNSADGSVSHGINDIVKIGDYYYLFGNSCIFKFVNLESGTNKSEQYLYRDLGFNGVSISSPEVITDNNGNYIVYSTYQYSTRPSIGINPVGLFFDIEKIKLPNNERSIKIT